MRPTAVRVVLAVAFSFTLAGLAPAQAQTTLTVGKAAPNADPIIPVNVGDQLGIFKKHGLDLKIVDFESGAKMTQALAAGSIDIGDGAGTEIVLAAKGVPAMAVCETAGPFPFLSVGVPYDSPAKSLDDLKGKKIGISSPGSLTDWLAHELAKQKGWGPNGITTVGIGNPAPGIIAAFRQGIVDADISVTSLFLTMEENKTGRVLSTVDKFVGPAASGTLYATEKLMKSNPQALRTFLVAWLETIDYMLSHKAETVAITQKITGFSESVMSREYDFVRDMYSRDCKFRPESMATLKRSFVELKRIEESVDLTKLYTEEFLPKK